MQPHIQPLFRHTASDPTDSPVLTRGPTISVHNFPCHNDPDTHMHLLGFPARDEGNHDNQHPRVCVFWAHDCAACRCSSGASARKSIRIWASNHLKPSTIDQAQQTFSFILACLLPTCPTVRWMLGVGLMAEARTELSLMQRRLKASSNSLPQDCSKHIWRMSHGRPAVKPRVLNNL